jgi:hypothetical protein
MSTLYSLSAAGQPINNRQVSQTRSAKQRNPLQGHVRFGMHQPQNAPTNSGCFQACFGWLRNLFRRRDPQVSSATPLIQPHERPVEVQERRQDFGVFQPSMRSVLPDSLELDHHENSTQSISTLPERGRFLKSVSGKSFTRVHEEDDLDRTGGRILLKTPQGSTLGIATVKEPVRVGSKKYFQSLRVGAVNLQQPTFHTIDEAAVVERLLKTAVHKAKVEGMSLMAIPKDGGEEVLYRQHGFKPMAEVLGQEPPPKYRSHLAVEFSRPRIHELSRILEEDTDEVVVGSPPGWREHKEKQRRLWEYRESQQGKMDKPDNF